MIASSPGKFEHQEAGRKNDLGLNTVDMQNKHILSILDKDESWFLLPISCPPVPGRDG